MNLNGKSSHLPYLKSNRQLLDALDYNSYGFFFFFFVPRESCRYLPLITFMLKKDINSSSSEEIGEITKKAQQPFSL